MRVSFLACALFAGCTVAAAADPAPSTVLVKRGDVQVTVADFNALMDKIPADRRDEFRANLERINSAVSSIFVSRELANEARATGFDKDPEVAVRLRLAEENLLAQAYMERFSNSIKYPDFEQRAKEVYQASTSRYTVPPTASIKMIVIDNRGISNDEAKRRAAEARAQLAAGESFDTVAGIYSSRGEAESRKHVAYNALPEAIAAVARTQPLGKPSEPVAIPTGYVLVVVEDRQPESRLPYEKVREQLIAEQQNAYRKAEIDKKLGTITSSKDVTMYTDAISSLVVPVDREAIHEKHEEAARKEQQEAARKPEQPGKPAGN